MKEITTTYTIVLDGKEHTYTDTYEAYSVREAHMNIMYHWSGVEKIMFVSDIVKQRGEAYEDFCYSVHRWSCKNC